MKIEEIRNALKNKAQNLNVATMATSLVAQDPSAPTFPKKPKMPTKQEQASQKEPAVVIPMTKAPEAPEAPIPPEPVAEAKSSHRPRGTKGKAKATHMTEIETIVAQYLKASIDYTTLPRCGNKPVLLKGGAEHLASVLGLTSSSSIVNRVQVLEKNFMLYEVATTVYDEDGKILAVGLGSCNTLETKYLKAGLAASLNTVLKMARKRSYVDAILSATGSSRIFTQDIEGAEQEKREA